MLPGFLHLWDSIIKRWISFLDNRIIWCWGQIVHLNILIDKLHKAVSVLFRCTKIRKSKPAWVRFSQSDVNGNNESSMTRCCLVLPSVAEHHCVLPGSLRFTNFLPKSQKQSRLCAICQSLCCECTICPQHHYFKSVWFSVILYWSNLIQPHWFALNREPSPLNL